MYTEFFGLRDIPFNVSPDPRFFFQTQKTRATLDCLTYGIQQRQGFILLTGEVGTGKTTLVNKVLHRLQGEPVASAFVFNPALNTTEFLDYIMSDFGIGGQTTLKSQMLWRLSKWLVERYQCGQTAVLIVDEAQNLAFEVLEDIRMLTNLETYNQKLLQIVLSGQPELEQKLKQPNLRQLRQRIMLRVKTYALSLEETHGYIAERLRIAGSDGRTIFTPEAIRAVYLSSHGIPRVINVLCEHGLIRAHAAQQKQVDDETIEEAARQFELNDVELPVEPLLRCGSDESIPSEDKARPPVADDTAGEPGAGLVRKSPLDLNSDDHETRQALPEEERVTSNAEPALARAAGASVGPSAVFAKGPSLSVKSEVSEALPVLEEEVGVSVDTEPVIQRAGDTSSEPSAAFVIGFPLDLSSKDSEALPVPEERVGVSLEAEAVPPRVGAAPSEPNAGFASGFPISLNSEDSETSRAIEEKVGASFSAEPVAPRSGDADGRPSAGSVIGFSPGLNSEDSEAPPIVEEEVGASVNTEPITPRAPDAAREPGAAFAIGVPLVLDSEHSEVPPAVEEEVGAPASAEPVPRPVGDSASKPSGGSVVRFPLGLNSEDSETPRAPEEKLGVSLKTEPAPRVPDTDRKLGAGFACSPLTIYSEDFETSMALQAKEDAENLGTTNPSPSNLRESTEPTPSALTREARGASSPTVMLPKFVSVSRGTIQPLFPQTPTPMEPPRRSLVSFAMAVLVLAVVSAVGGFFLLDFSRSGQTGGSDRSAPVVSTEVATTKAGSTAEHPASKGSAQQGSRMSSAGGARAPKGMSPAVSSNLGVFAAPNSAPPLAEGMGRVVVSANVEGASISIDGRTSPRWLTPHTFALASGNRHIVISKEGYEDAYLELAVEPGGTHAVTGELEAAVGVVNIVTNPSGLEVSIDGRPSAPSPVEATVEAGEHTFIVKIPGFQDYRGTFTVKSGSAITRELDFSGIR